MALRWHADVPQPGLVEVSIQDAFGIEHRIIEKVSVVGPIDAGPTSSYPTEVWIEAEVEASDRNGVTVNLPYSMETTDGASRLTFAAGQVDRA